MGNSHIAIAHVRSPVAYVDAYLRIDIPPHAIALIAGTTSIIHNVTWHKCGASEPDREYQMRGASRWHRENQWQRASHKSGEDHQERASHRQ